MPKGKFSRSSLSIVIVALLLFAIAGMVGGFGNPLDADTIHYLAAHRLSFITPAIIITYVGGAPALLAILGVATAGLVIARRWRTGVALVAIVISGRLAIEALKLMIDRPRPHFDPHPVPVASLSFPSGHAGNTMLTFLALALLVAPEKWRRPAVVAAIAASGAIGVTRPMLGVHWPSDIIGGWALGIAWVVVGVALSRRWIEAPE